MFPISMCVRVRVRVRVRVGVGSWVLGEVRTKIKVLSLSFSLTCGHSAAQPICVYMVTRAHLAKTSELCGQLW